MYSLITTQHSSEMSQQVSYGWLPVLSNFELIMTTTPLILCR